MKKVKDSITNIADTISLAIVAKKYFKKDKSWLYHKLNEDEVNGRIYKFNDKEIDILIKSLSDISSQISISIQQLEEFRRTRKKEKGAFFTEVNPFIYPLFQKWMRLIPITTTFVEPYAGNNNIPLLLSNAGFSVKWKCFDICPPLENNMPQHKVVKRDCINKFPKGYKVAVTNPPYLEKSSASRQNLSFPQSMYNNLYKICLNEMLNNCSYVAAIIPASFISSGLFHNRIYGITYFDVAISSQTSYPVCLALFIPKNESGDFPIYTGDSYIGTYCTLKKFDIREKGGMLKRHWKFNVPNGEIGICCIDNSIYPSIYFCKGEELSADKIKISSRHYTRVSGLPTHVKIDTFINKCNQILYQYRNDTKDIFLTPFRGLRKDGMLRRRIDFNTIRCIMDEALDI